MNRLAAFLLHLYDLTGVAARGLLATMFADFGPVAAIIALMGCAAVLILKRKK